MKKFISVALITLFAIYFIATPYIALNKIKNAADQKNYNEISQYVEFSTLRENIKEQINSRMFKQIKRNKNNFLAGLSLAVGGFAADNLVDNYINPTSIVLLMQGTMPKENNTKNIVIKNNHKDKIKSKTFIDIETGYISIDRFFIRINEKLENKKKIEFILERKNLINWKITNIILPI